MLGVLSISTVAVPARGQEPWRFLLPEQRSHRDPRPGDAAEGEVFGVARSAHGDPCRSPRSRSAISRSTRPFGRAGQLGGDPPVGRQQRPDDLRPGDRQHADRSGPGRVRSGRPAVNNVFSRSEVRRPSSTRSTPSRPDHGRRVDNYDLGMGLSKRDVTGGTLSWISTTTSPAPPRPGCRSTRRAGSSSLSYTQPLLQGAASRSTWRRSSSPGSTPSGRSSR